MRLAKQHLSQKDDEIKDLDKVARTKKLESDKLTKELTKIKKNNNAMQDNSFRVKKHRNDLDTENLKLREKNRCLQATCDDLRDRLSVMTAKCHSLQDADSSVTLKGAAALPLDNLHHNMRPRDVRPKEPTATKPFPIKAIPPKIKDVRSKNPTKRSPAPNTGSPLSAWATGSPKTSPSQRFQSQNQSKKKGQGIGNRRIKHQESEQTASEQRCRYRGLCKFRVQDAGHREACRPLSDKRH